MSYFKYADPDFNVNNNFYEIFTNCQAQTGPKIKNYQNLFTFDLIDISNMPIPILTSKITSMAFFFFVAFFNLKHPTFRKNEFTHFDWRCLKECRTKKSIQFKSSTKKHVRLW